MLWTIWRRFWITVAALLALCVALAVVAVSLLLLLVMWVWARLTGRPLVRAVWQQKATARASGYWQQMRGGGMPPGTDAVDAVVDVEAREVSPRSPPSPTPSSRAPLGDVVALLPQQPDFAPGAEPDLASRLAPQRMPGDAPPRQDDSR